MSIEGTYSSAKTKPSVFKESGLHFSDTYSYHGIHI